MKLVHLVGFITKKSVTIHGHMNVKKDQLLFEIFWLWRAFNDLLVKLSFICFLIRFNVVISVMTYFYIPKTISLLQTPS